jgi:hypothetical protein
MKLQTIYSAFIFTLTVLTACSGNDKKNDSAKDGDKNETGTKTAGKENVAGNTGSKLDGAWVIKRAEGNMRSMNEGTVYDFNGSKLTLGKDGFNNPGTTEITDSTFSFQAEGNKYKFMYDYKFNGDTLVVSMQSSGQVFHMMKE